MDITIHEMATRFASIGDPNVKIQEIIQEKSQAFIKFNTERLRLHGTDKDGVKLKYPYESPYYTKQKLKLNPLGLTDLLKTGDWYNSLYAEVSRDTISIKSDLEKDERLTELYGPDIRGVSSDDKATFGNTIVLPQFIQYIRTITMI